MTRFIFITGGVVSGLGKGITAAALGRLLKLRGLRVSAQKLDPYINVDPGTMNPLQHGEVYVTDDGAETDLDLGHYERFIDEDLHRHSNLTAGRVYASVIAREREGGYAGGTVQMIPHVTEEIKGFVYRGASHQPVDIMITEIGGTVGDMESEPFVEAIRQIAEEQGRENCLFIHVTLLPYVTTAGEYKSKPTQHSIKTLRALGITPHIVVLRTDTPAPAKDEIKEKIARFCNINKQCIIDNTTVESLYEAPLMLHANGLDTAACRLLGLDVPPPALAEWKTLVNRINTRAKHVTIALVGKYVQLRDAYLSVAEALAHAGFALGAYVNINWINSAELTTHNIKEKLCDADGVLIPGGFGERGVEGKIAAARYARERDIPFLGICLGMQVAVIEFARHVCGLAGAHSTEFDPDTPHPVIHLLPGQEGKENSGGTLRLGAYPCVTQENSRLRALYNSDFISERHRHRYEFNNAYLETIAARGMTCPGTSPDGTLVEAVEIPAARFYTGVQYHPEFKSRPNKPHPLFTGLVQGALNKKE